MSALGILFAVVWIVVGFFVLRAIGQRFFHGKNRAEVAAISVVLAFAIGAVWPFSNRLGTPASTASAPNTTPKIELTATMIRNLMAARTGPDTGSMDVLSSKPGDYSRQASAFRAGSTVYATGWVADQVAKTPVPGIVLVVDSKRLIDGTSVYGKARPDIAKAYGDPAMAFTGFYDVPVPTTGLGKGPHTIQVAGLSSDGKFYYLVGLQRTFTLR